MRALRPPDGARATLRDDLANCHEGLIDAFRTDAPPDHVGEQVRALEPVMGRWQEMRDQAARDQRLLASPARRRRASSVWLGTLGICLLLLGFAGARASDLAALGVTDAGTLVAAGSLVGGAIMLVGALFLALRPHSG